MLIRHGVLNARRGASKNPALTVAGPKAALMAAILQPGSAARLADAGQITLNGDLPQLETYAYAARRVRPQLPYRRP